MQQFRGMSASGRTFCCSIVGVLALIAAAPSVRADSSVSAAQQTLAQAQAQSTQDHATLASDQAALNAAQAQLSAMDSQIATLNQEVTAQTKKAADLKQQLAADQTVLASLVRSEYETTKGAGMLVYVMSADSIASVMQRANDVSSVNDSGNQLVGQIHSEQQSAQEAITSANAAKDHITVLREQALTQAAIIAAQTDQAAIDAAHADSGVVDANGVLNALLHPPVGPAVGGSAPVYHAVAGDIFTIDTDLTQPSGESAGAINQFLSGTALSGLGQSYVNAEHTYHVSALYLVAHSILESGWGSSQIAHDKHNLFGYGADDSNPYGDAMSFPSFDACIQFVASKVAQNYLTPGGAFYHGPTLRGMNVCYASDPTWALKIASIANTIPR